MFRWRTGTALSLITIFFTLQLPRGGFTLNWWGNNVFTNSAFSSSFVFSVLLTYWPLSCTAADWVGKPLIPTPPDHPFRVSG
jgi:hypothetical protein